MSGHIKSAVFGDLTEERAAIKTEVIGSIDTSVVVTASVLDGESIIAEQTSDVMGFEEAGMMSGEYVFTLKHRPERPGLRITLKTEDGKVLDVYEYFVEASAVREAKQPITRERKPMTKSAVWVGAAIIAILVIAFITQALIRRKHRKNSRNISSTTYIVLILLIAAGAMFYGRIAFAFEERAIPIYLRLVRADGTVLRDWTSTMAKIIGNYNEQGYVGKAYYHPDPYNQALEEFGTFGFVYSRVCPPCSSLEMYEDGSGIATEIFDARPILDNWRRRNTSTFDEIADYYPYKGAAHAGTAVWRMSLLQLLSGNADWFARSVRESPIFFGKQSLHGQAYSYSYWVWHGGELPILYVNSPIHDNESGEYDQTNIPVDFYVQISDYGQQPYVPLRWGDLGIAVDYYKDGGKIIPSDENRIPFHNRLIPSSNSPYGYPNYTYTGSMNDQADWVGPAPTYPDPYNPSGDGWVWQSGHHRAMYHVWSGNISLTDPSVLSTTMRIMTYFKYMTQTGHQDHWEKTFFGTFLWLNFPPPMPVPCNEGSDDAGLDDKPTYIGVVQFTDDYGNVISPSIDTPSDRSAMRLKDLFDGVTVPEGATQLRGSFPDKTRYDNNEGRCGFRLQVDRVGEGAGHWELP